MARHDRPVRSSGCTDARGDRSQLASCDAAEGPSMRARSATVKMASPARPVVRVAPWGLFLATMLLGCLPRQGAPEPARSVPDLADLVEVTRKIDGPSRQVLVVGDPCFGKTQAVVFGDIPDDDVSALARATRANDAGRIVSIRADHRAAEVVTGQSCSTGSQGHQTLLYFSRTGDRWLLVGEDERVVCGSFHE